MSIENLKFIARKIIKVLKENEQEVVSMKPTVRWVLKEQIFTIGAKSM